MDGSRIKEFKIEDQIDIHESNITAMVISYDNKFIIAGHNNSDISIWSIQKNVIINVLKGNEKGVCSLVISSDDNILISGGEKGDIIE